MKNSTNVCGSLLGLLISALFFLSASAQAQSTEEGASRAPASYHPSSPGEPPPAVPSDAAPSRGADDYGLSGNWGGLRNRLDDSGVSLALVYKGEGSRVFSGGVERGSSYLQNADLKLLIDAEKLAGWKGATFFFYGLGNWGGSAGGTPSRHVGDVQATSNLESAADRVRLYEAWYEQKFAGGKSSILFGIHDLNSEFYVTDSSTFFFNASFGIGKEISQTGTAGPSIFPNPTGAIRLSLQPADHWRIQTGFFNAVAADPEDSTRSRAVLSGDDGFLAIQEISYSEDGDRRRKYAIGAWNYTRTFDDRDGSGNQVGNSGAYLLLDQAVSKSASVFLRAGTASTHPNAVKDNVSAGTTCKGIFGSRPEDKAGLAFTRVTSSDTGSAETAFEGTYRFEFGSGVALQPDLQYVLNQGFDGSVPDALVGALRLEVGF